MKLSREEIEALKAKIVKGTWVKLLPEAGVVSTPECSMKLQRLCELALAAHDMAEALEFYADPFNYESQDLDGNCIMDNGFGARKALTAVECDKR